jgi:hypothetical protein
MFIPYDAGNAGARLFELQAHAPLVVRSVAPTPIIVQIGPGDTRLCGVAF